MDNKKEKMDMGLEKVIKIALLVLIIAAIAAVVIKTFPSLIDSSPKVEYAKDDYELESTYDLSVDDVQNSYRKLGMYSGVCYWYTRPSNYTGKLIYQGKCIGFGMNDEEFQISATDNVYYIESNSGYMWIFALEEDGTMVPMYSNVEVIISSTPLS